jgi:hypothetical protein
MTLKQQDVLSITIVTIRTSVPWNFGSLARQVLEMVDPISEELCCAIEREEHDGEKLVDPSRTLEFFQRAL